MTTVATTTDRTIATNGNAGLVVRAIAIDLLHESKHNPRTIFPDQEIEELKNSLLASGQLTPLLVRPHPGKQGYFEIGAGACRRRAAVRAKLDTLLCVVRELDDATFVELVNVENRQRHNLHPLNEAAGFADWMKTAGLKIPDIAARIGLSVKYVYDRLKLLQLIKPAQKLFLEGRFEAGHAIILARLSKDDQERAIALDADERWGRIGGLFQDERVEVEGDEELELADPKKAVSVREFQGWVQRNVRFDPTKVDQGDLRFDFPETAAALDQAQQGKRKVLHITHDYRVADDAKDPRRRTYGENSWKRADGKEGSKPCEYSAIGVVVAGPGRGEYLQVCVNRDRCEVHFGPEVKARRKREAERAKHAASNGKASEDAGEVEKPKKAPKVDPEVMPADTREEWEQEELERRVPEMVKAVKAVAAELKISEEICWNLSRADLYLNGWNKIGRHGWDNKETSHRERLEDLLCKSLPGKFASNVLNPKDGPAAKTNLAFQIWIARDTNDLDASIEAAVTARWKAHRAEERKKEAAAKAAKPKGKDAGGVKIRKTGKLAGDVRRAKAKKAATR